MYNTDKNLQFRKDETFGDFLHILREDKATSSKTILEEDEANKPDEAPQNTKTVEEPEIDLEDLGLEDHEKDDFNKAGAKVKPDSEENKDKAIEEVPEDKTQRLDSSKNESTDILWLCNNCDTTFRNNVNECIHCLSNMVERITPVTEGDDVPFDENSELMRDYESWVEKEGHLTRQASSVLRAYIKDKGLGKEEYRELAGKMGFKESKSKGDDVPFDSEALLATYMKARANGRSRAEAVKAVVNKADDMDAFAVRNMLMQKGIREQEDDKYNPEKNLKSELTEMFYTKEFALVGEQKSATGVHLEYRRGDELIKVFIED
jgi:hypothetical protein